MEPRHHRIPGSERHGRLPDKRSDRRQRDRRGLETHLFQSRTLTQVEDRQVPNRDGVHDAARPKQVLDGRVLRRGNSIKLRHASPGRFGKVDGIEGIWWVPAATKHPCARPGQGIASGSHMAVGLAAPGASDAGAQIVDALHEIFIKCWPHSTTPSAIASIRPRTSRYRPSRIRSAGES